MKNNKVIVVNSLGLGGGEKVAISLAEHFSCPLWVLEPTKHFDTNANIKCLSFLPLYFPNLFHRLVSLLLFPFYIVKYKVDTIQSHLVVSNVICCLFRLIFSYKLQIVQHGSFRRLEKARFFIVFSFFYKMADEMVCISSDMYADAIRLFENSKIVTVNNPHDIEKYIRRSLLSPDKSIVLSMSYFVVVGRLIELKRISDILKALALSHSSDHLVVLGDGPLRGTLINEANELGVSEKVHFLGSMSNPFPYIKRAKGLILASESEGFPNCIIESLAVQTPVVSSNCISGPSEILKLSINDNVEFVSNEVGILYSVGDVDTLMNIINNFNNFRFNDKTMLEYASTYDINTVASKYYI